MEARGKTAFVIWLDADPEDSGEVPVYRGRVEHVASATRAPFVSKEELFAFIERAVRGQQGPGTEGDG
jgi:hypothetical protein